ncbi:MAG: hypothetical protein ACK5LL_06615 [Suipraeoptans sp.]
MSNGWISLHRELLDKSIWQESTPEQKSILITLMLMASHKEKKWEWQGAPILIQPGQMITSLDCIAEKSGKGISIKNVRTALTRFEKLGFLAKQPAKTGSLITIVNWGIYQGGTFKSGIETGSKQNNERQTAGTKVATINNDNNTNNFNNYKDCMLISDKIIGHEIKDISKKMGISVNEMTGTLIRLWMYGYNNADSDGYIPNMDYDDLEDIINSGMSHEHTARMRIEGFINNGFLIQKYNGFLLNGNQEYYMFFRKGIDDIEKIYNIVSSQ